MRTFVCHSTNGVLVRLISLGLYWLWDDIYRTPEQVSHALVWVFFINQNYNGKEKNVLVRCCRYWFVSRNASINTKFIFSLINEGRRWLIYIITKQDYEDDELIKKRYGYINTKIIYYTVWLLNMCYQTSENK